MSSGIFSKIRAAAEESKQANSALISQNWSKSQLESRSEKIFMAGATTAVSGMIGTMLIAAANQAADINANFPALSDSVTRAFGGLSDAVNSLGSFPLDSGGSIQNMSLIAAGAAVSGLVLMISSQMKPSERPSAVDWATGIKTSLASAFKKVLGITEGQSGVPNSKLSPQDIKAMAARSIELGTARLSAMGLDQEDQTQRLHQTQRQAG